MDRFVKYLNLDESDVESRVVEYLDVGRIDLVAAIS